MNLFDTVGCHPLSQGQGHKAVNVDVICKNVDVICKCLTQDMGIPNMSNVLYIDQKLQTRLNFADRHTDGGGVEGRLSVIWCARGGGIIRLRSGSSPGLSKMN